MHPGKIDLNVCRRERKWPQSRKQQGQTEEAGKKQLGCLQNTEETGEREGERQRESLSVTDSSQGLLTSLEDSGESSVVVVETVRPEP